jgi:hypothetical protein
MMFCFEVIFTNGFRGEYDFYMPDEDYVKRLAEEHYGEGTVKSVKLLGMK